MARCVGPPSTESRRRTGWPCSHISTPPTGRGLGRKRKTTSDRERTQEQSEMTRKKAYALDKVRKRYSVHDVLGRLEVKWISMGACGTVEAEPQPSEGLDSILEPLR